MNIIEALATILRDLHQKFLLAFIKAEFISELCSDLRFLPSPLLAKFNQCGKPFRSLGVHWWALIPWPLTSPTCTLNFTRIKSIRIVIIIIFLLRSEVEGSTLIDAHPVICPTALVDSCHDYDFGVLILYLSQMFLILFWMELGEFFIKFAELNLQNETIIDFPSLLIHS